MRKPNNKEKKLKITFLSISKKNSSRMKKNNNNNDNERPWAPPPFHKFNMESIDREKYMKKTVVSPDNTPRPQESPKK